MEETNLVVLDEKDLPGVIQEFQDAFYDIPFGNSKFQIENFVVNSQHTPARMYRAVGLSSSAKIRALREALYSRKKEEIDIEELEEKIADPLTSKFDKRRFQLDIEQKMENREYTKKLVNDALHELSQYYRIFKSLPKLTRPEFEQEEKKHFKIRLNKAVLGIQGARESLDNMGDDPFKLPEAMVDEIKHLYGETEIKNLPGVH